MVWQSPVRASAVRSRQQQPEPVAGEAGHGARRGIGEAGRDLPEQAVALGMAQRVVDGAEAAQVEDSDGHRRASQSRGFDPRHKARSRQRASQWIMGCEIEQPLFGPALFDAAPAQLRDDDAQRESGKTGVQRGGVEEYGPIDLKQR